MYKVNGKSTSCSDLDSSALGSLSESKENTTDSIILQKKQKNNKKLKSIPSKENNKKKTKKSCLHMVI